MLFEGVGCGNRRGALHKSGTDWPRGGSQDGGGMDVMAAR